MKPETITLLESEWNYILRLIENRYSFIKHYPDPYHLERDKEERFTLHTIEKHIKAQL